MILVLSILIAFISYLFGVQGNVAISEALILYLFLRLILKSREIFVFREFALFLYAINYLISPAITYSLDQTLVSYPMKINPDLYFSLSIPGFLFFLVGMYSIRTTCFKIKFNDIHKLSIVNEGFLKKITLIGLTLKIASLFVSGEIAFIIYLLGLIRFVGAFALMGIDLKRYIIWPIAILVFELALGFIFGAYHDAIMWVIFFGLYYVYVNKPSVTQILLGGGVAILLLLVIQAVKYKYREEVWQGTKEASLETVYEVGSKNVSSENLLGDANLLTTLNRGNQAWIFASTVDNMDRGKNFQGMTNVNKYLEAALLPRILAPNKIKSGDKEIFNEFSGHTINGGTSMGLGIFADGYVAYGATGVYLFAFVLGLIFSLTFKLVERWTKVSPFYVLLLLPLLNYAVRPDCELQTTINHLFKGILLYGFLVYLTRKRFTLDSAENQRKLNHLNLMK
jgi:hypothetical protein